MKIISVALSAVLCASAADATVFTYSVSGTFADGTTMSGRFSFNDQIYDSIRQFSAVSIRLNRATPVTLTATTGFTAPALGGTNTAGQVTFAGPNGTRLMLGLIGNYSRAPSLTAITSPSFNSGGVYYTAYSVAGVSSHLVSGSVTQVSPAVPPVPEPITWGLMLLGFGMVGAGLRSRRRRTTVTYA